MSSAYNVWFKNGKSYHKVNTRPLSLIDAKVLAMKLNEVKVENWYSYLVRPARRTHEKSIIVNEYIT